jgi:hypothetical protein
VSRLRRQDPIRDNLRAAPARAHRAVQGLYAKANEAPIIVLGHQKSGTSAVAGLLAELTGRSVAIDFVNEDRWPIYQRVTTGEVSFERFVRRNRLDFSRDIVKEPNLTFLYPQLRERFPDARFLMVVRDPRTNAKSVLNRLDLPGDVSDLSQERLAALRRGWSLVFDPGWLRLTPGTYVELLSRRWNLCADVFLENQPSFHLVRYEDFLADKLGTLERLASQLELSCPGDIRSRLDEPFQPAGDRRVPVGMFFGAENLARIEDICEARMRRLGYSQAMSASGGATPSSSP